MSVVLWQRARSRRFSLALEILDQLPIFSVVGARFAGIPEEER